jgi:hypothetical protein
MPLYPDAERLIRSNLAVVARGKKPRAVVIGELTPRQIEDVNAQQRSRKLPEMDNKIVFVGLHLHDSRFKRDCYSVDQIVAQIASAMSEKSRLIKTFNRTAIENPIKRDDGLGNMVNDKAILECTAKFPSMELSSVIPRGDINRPDKQITETIEVSVIEEVTNLPG